MPNFLFEGKSRSGKLVKGEYSAANRDELFKYLRSRGILATKVRQKGKSISLQIGTGVKQEDITNFARQFSAMISAGLPLLQCLNILYEQTENPRFKKILLSVSGSVESGNSLADSLAKHPKIFPELFVNMIAAGEVGGILDTILLRLSDFLEKAASLRRKIKGAMIYPIVITVIAILAVVVLLIFVVPIFTGIFSDFGGELPKPTQFVVNMSNFLKTPLKVFPLIGVVALIVFIFTRYHKTTQGRYNVDKFLLKLPIFGDLLRKTSIAEFSRTLGTLLTSGVSIIEALEVTSKTASNTVVKRALKSMISAISEGKTITEPMKETGVFPPMVIQMVAVGEESGGLDQMLAKLASYYDEEVDAAVSALTAAMEPIFLLLIAIIVGGTVIVMYLPMFDLISVVGE